MKLVAFFSFLVAPLSFAGMGDQILTPRHLFIQINPSESVIQASKEKLTTLSKNAPAKKESAVASDDGYFSFMSQKHKEKVQVAIQFSENEIVDLGEGPIAKGAGTFEVSKEKYLELTNAYGHRIGSVLVLDKSSGQTATRYEEIGKIFIGTPEYDFQCKTPVLVSDYNDTLNRGDSCTSQAIDHLMDNSNLTIVVVSTMGSDVSGSLKRLQFKHAERILVLDYGTPGDSMSSSKSSRIARNLWASGACIVGMVGDSRQIDGEAALELGIPFFAVNQRDGAEYKTETKDKEICSSTLPQEKSLSIASGVPACDVDYKESDIREIECAIPVLGFLWDKKSWVRVPNTLSIEHVISEVERYNRLMSYNGGYYGAPHMSEPYNPCEGGLPTRQERKGKACALTLPLEYDFDPAQTDCKPKYVKKKAKVEVRTLVRSWPSFDVNSYAPNSFYANDWCALGPHVEQVLSQIGQ